MAMLGTDSLTHFFQLPWKPAILRKGFKGVYCNCNENMAVLGTNYSPICMGLLSQLPWKLVGRRIGKFLLLKLFCQLLWW